MNKKQALTRNGTEFHILPHCDIQSLILLAILFGLSACGGGGSSDNSSSAPTNNSETSEVPDICDGLTIDAILDDLEETRPSWDQIDCFTSDMTRLALPEFGKRVYASSTKFGMQADQLPLHLDYWDDIMSTFATNISPALMASLPVHTDGDGNTITYPLNADELDEILRAGAAAFIREKQLGRRVLVTLLYPPDKIDQGFSSQDEFLNWVAGAYNDEVVAVAQMAERVKAEYLLPFPIEVEVFLNNQSGFIDTLSASQKTSLAQSLVDQTYAAASANFNGQIMAFSYFNYYLNPGDTYWKNVTYAAFDEISFSVFPNCDVATTNDYLDTLLTHDMDIVQRDGIPWVLGEITLEEALFSACDNGGDTFEAMKNDLYQAVFDKLNALSTQPSGVLVGSDPDDSAEVITTVNDYLNSK